MIDPSFDVEVPTDPGDWAADDIAVLEQKVADLENKLSLKTQQWEFAGEQVRKYAAQVDSFESALKYNEWDFDGDTLNDLASFFDITLEREYTVDITVRFTGTVSVPMDYDIDDLENDLSAELNTHHYGNSSVEVDFMEDGMEIDYQEV